MGILRFIHKQIIGEDGLEYVTSYKKNYSDIKKYNSKSIRTASEHRKLQLEQQKLWVDPKSKKDKIINFLSPECTYTNEIGQTWATINHLSLPTEKHYNISLFFYLSEKNNRLDKFGIFDIFKYQDLLKIIFLYVNRKELSELILALGGKKHQNFDEFKPPLLGELNLGLLINIYNEIEENTDEYSEFINENEQEVYSDGIRYISIWLFKRNYGISPNTNEDNFINSEEIFIKYPSLVTIKIKIQNHNFEYVLGYPEKILIEYFNV